MRLLALTTSLAACAATGPGVQLGQPTRLDAVTITPLALLEDSRCPQDVQCIQAGTVRINARLSGSASRLETEMKLGTPVPFAGSFYALTGACPAPHTDQPAAERVYRFTFASHAITASDWRPETSGC
jgi:hypothetical protein